MGRKNLIDQARLAGLITEERCVNLDAITGSQFAVHANLDLTEKQFQERVIVKAKEEWWKVYHTLDSRGCEEGFFDLVLLRDRLVHIELKAEDGIVSEAQWEWYDKLIAAGQEAYIFRPSDWDVIMHILRLRLDRTSALHAANLVSVHDHWGITFPQKLKR